MQCSVRRLAVLLVLSSAVGCTRQSPTPQPSAVRYCAMCGMACHERCAAQAVLPDGSVRDFCCPHCVLGQMSLPAANLPADVEVSLTDWETSGRVSAAKAVLVVESDIVPCCNPALIGFADRAAAESFCREHHGRIVTWDECLAQWKKERAARQGHGAPRAPAPKGATGR